jgi:hypothetical protein
MLVKDETEPSEEAIAPRADVWNLGLVQVLDQGLHGLPLLPSHPARKDDEGEGGEEGDILVDHRTQRLHMQGDVSGWIQCARYRHMHGDRLTL